MNRKPHVWCNYLLVLALAIALSMSPGSPQTPSVSTLSTEGRGVWLTNVGSGVLFMPWAVNRALHQLSQLNFNTVYPVVWNRGDTFYPSAVARRAIGRSQQPLLKFMRLGADVLELIVKQGHRQGLSVIPWFEYGFMAPVGSELAKRHPDWLTQSIDGSKTRFEGRLEQDLIESPNTNVQPHFSKVPQSIRKGVVTNQVWLNPINPQVQQFILDLIVEVVTKYDIDGIQLDDHFGMPVQFGYDPFTVRLYKQEHQDISPPKDPFDSEWMRWRANKITNFMGRLRGAVKAVKPHVRVSLSPNSHFFANRYYLQDWLTWVQRGLVDELVLQVYRNDISSFVAELSQPAVQIARSRIPVGVGILTGTWRTPVAIKQIQQQVRVARELGFHRVSFFYWDSLWGYIAPESPRQRRRAFREIFPSKAARPDMDLKSVPLPS